jgi:hypothetical protein
MLTISMVETFSPKGSYRPSHLPLENMEEMKHKGFEEKIMMTLVLMQKIKDEGKDWIMASAKHLLK